MFLILDIKVLGGNGRGPPTCRKWRGFIWFPFKLDLTQSQFICNTQIETRVAIKKCLISILRHLRHQVGNLNLLSMSCIGGKPPGTRQSIYNHPPCWRCPWCNWRCLWCNGYRRRIWTRRHEFKSWTWLIAFHIALIPLGKVWIQIFSLQLWVNSRAD